MASACAFRTSRSADYLTLHVGLFPQTTGIINARTLATMKKNVRIVNCARGELIDDAAALVEALSSGKVAGAALDVFSQEPLKNSPYFGLDNVILTPHIAGYTGEAQEAVGVQIAQQVKDYLSSGSAERGQPALHDLCRSARRSSHTSSWRSVWVRSSLPLAAGNLESIHLSYRGRLAQGEEPSWYATPPSRGSWRIPTWLIASMPYPLLRSAACRCREGTKKKVRAAQVRCLS